MGDRRALPRRLARDRLRAGNSERRRTRRTQRKRHLRRGRGERGLLGQQRELMLDRLKLADWPAELDALVGVVGCDMQQTSQPASNLRRADHRAGLRDNFRG